MSYSYEPQKFVVKKVDSSTLKGVSAEGNPFADALSGLGHTAVPMTDRAEGLDPSRKDLIPPTFIAGKGPEDVK